MAQVLSVNIATTATRAAWAGTERATGIDKRPVTHAVRVFDDHVDGDTVVDRKHHGGPHKAVYAYAREDAEWWEQNIGRALAPGAFGENLTTTGMNLNAAVIGERWRVGSALLEVSEPRIPCRVFAEAWDRPQLVKEFTDAKRSGTYLRIIEDGMIEVGNAIDVLSTPPHGVTVGTAFMAKTGQEVSRAQLLPALADLPPKWQAWLTSV